jgi:hypothetical protein
MTVDRDLRRRDWAATGRVDRAREARPRSRRSRRLRTALLRERSAQAAEDRRQPASGAAPGTRPRRPAAHRQAERLAPSVSRRTRRLPRHPPLQALSVATSAVAAGIDPSRRIYDLRHTFATFALRAGISTFDLSRYMGASLTMIDRHYGHLARDEHAIQLLDERMAANVHGGRWWTLGGRHTSRTPSAPTTETAVEQGRNRSPLTDSNRRPPPYHAIQAAAGGSRRQRFPVSSSHFGASGGPNLCHPLRPLCSITVPSQSAQKRTV